MHAEWRHCNRRGRHETVRDVQASDVKAQLEFAKRYTLSADDINRIVQQRKAKGLLRKPLNTQRVELLMAKRAAEEANDEAAIQRCCDAAADPCMRDTLPMALHGHSRPCWYSRYRAAQVDSTPKGMQW